MASKTSKILRMEKYRQTCPPHVKQFKADLFDRNKRIVIAEGLPSTGKTKCAIEAGVEQVASGKYEKLILVRPVIIPACGLLPGLLNEKMAPYTRQGEIYIEMCSQEDLQEMLFRKKIEIMPADLLQGNRFMDCYVLIDEAQHIHSECSFATLTRMGENTKMVLIGDTSKGQAAKKIGKNSILNYAADKLRDKDYAGVHEFYDKSCILGDDVTRDLSLTIMDDFM